MDPTYLRAFLDVLRASGVRKARVITGGDGEFEVEFEDRLVPASGLMDADGKPIDLDEGMPELGRDDYDPMAVEKANSPKKDTK